MRFVALTLCAILAVSNAAAEMPERQPERHGWNAAALDRAFAYAQSLGTDSLAVVTDGVVVRAMGDLGRRYDVHSMRKAFLSALVGQHLGPGAGRIDLDATLAALDIDDFPKPLSPRQRRATVLHLVKSISGIDHLAAAEDGQAAERTRRLGSGENEPGTKWAYNNWDYNALTTIFERRTGMGIAAAFQAGIAAPLGMEDYTPASVRYVGDPGVSQHRAAMFRMSARDLVRFGQLYLSLGTWNGKQVLPRGWVARITGDYTATGDRGLHAGHGYLWWIPGPETGLPPGTYWALGLGFQAVFVIPAWKTVIVHQADTTAFRARVVATAREQNIGIGAALEQVVLYCLAPANASSDYCRNDRFILRREFDRLIALLAAARRS
ncbi:MAG: serine hydrolase [Rhodospirillaceae bacterium]|nr:serine hydrolase [Rhodospirillaceae bacterium]